MAQITTAYQKRAAVIEAYRRGRFFYRDEEDVRARYEIHIGGVDLMEGELARHAPGLVAKFGNTLSCPTFPLIRTLSDQKAVQFEESVTIEMVGPDGRAATESQYPILAKLPGILREIGCWGAFDKANKLLVSHKAAAVWARLTRDGRVVVTALPPYCLRVDPNEDCESDTLHARRIVVPRRGDAYPRPDESLVAYEYLNGVYYGNPTNDRGEPLPVDLPEAPGAVLTHQGYPIVIWTEEDSDSPLPPLPLNLLRSQATVNLILAVVEHSFRVGAHGQPYLKKAKDAGAMPAPPLDEVVARTIAADGGAPPPPSSLDVPAPLRIGNLRVSLSGYPHDAPVMPEGWELDLLQARIDPLVYMRYAEAHIKLAYAAEGMRVKSVDLFNPEPSNYSMGAKLVDAAPVEDQKQRREGRLALFTERTLNVVRGLWNQIADEADKLPTDLRFRVRFGNLWNPSILTDQSAVQGLVASFACGLADPAEVRASIESIPLEDAKAKVKSSAGLFKFLQEFKLQASSTETTQQATDSTTPAA